MTTSANEIMRAARIRLSSHPTHACLASALWAVTLKEDTECQIGGHPTMGVSKDWVLYYHPDVAKWPLETIETIWLHEIWHLLRSHAARAEALAIGPQSHMGWNIAADMEINDGLIEQRLPFPPGCSPVTPASMQFPQHLLAEEYYGMLQKQAQQSKQGQGKGQGQGQGTQVGGSGADSIQRPWETGTGEGESGEGKDAKSGQSGKGTVQKRVIQAELIKRQVAEAIQRSRGSIPGSIARWAGKVLKARVIPWDTIIRATIGRIVTAGKREDYTYSRPSRRDFPGGFIAPGQFGTQPEIAVGVDTSGSMVEADLKRAVEVIQSVLEYHGRTHPVTVISGDTCVNNVKKTLSAQKVDLVGGGGTDMRELIAHAETLRPKPAALVLVTDGYTPWPAQQTVGMQLVVLLVGGSDGTGVPQWATVVKLTPEEE